MSRCLLFVVAVALAVLLGGCRSGSSGASTTPTYEVDKILLSTPVPVPSGGRLSTSDHKSISVATGGSHGEFQFMFGPKGDGTYGAATLDPSTDEMSVLSGYGIVIGWYPIFNGANARVVAGAMGMPGPSWDPDDDNTFIILLRNGTTDRVIVARLHPDSSNPTSVRVESASGDVTITSAAQFVDVPSGGPPTTPAALPYNPFDPPSGSSAEHEIVYEILKDAKSLGLWHD